MKTRQIAQTGWILLATLVTFAGCNSTTPRSPGAVAPPDPATLVKMTVTGVRFVPETGAHLVLLESAEGADPPRSLPIFIGEREALVLNMKLSRQSTPRPMTHDLTLSLLTTLGGEIRHIVIEDVQDGIFLARIYLADTGGRLRSVDSRASDAIILGVAAGKPIHADRQVLQKSGTRTPKPSGPAIDI